MIKKQQNKTKDLPLQFAQQLSTLVNTEWENGNFLKKVTPITQELLKFWFTSSFADNRMTNFHKGQKQAILNTIYCHEILKTKNTLELYQTSSNGLLDNKGLYNTLMEDKYSYPKYCIKMATGTGKTWVLNALLIWQMLNAKNPIDNGVIYTKNFLLVAPGVIVYERLLDTLLGKEQSDGKRDFLTSDIKKYQDLFIPIRFRDTVFAFVQNNVVKKEEIGHKITGDGIIAVANWHQVKDDNKNIEQEKTDSILDPTECINEIIPIRPGSDNGHSLDVFDTAYLREDKLKFLSNLPNLCVFNDEAHHLYGLSKKEEDLEWQKSIDKLAKNHKGYFIQVDFTATPYHNSSNSRYRAGKQGRKTQPIKDYFPHIIVDFDLKSAINNSLVKIIGIDKREEWASISNDDLNFKSIRDNGKVIAISPGQRLMLKAGLAKLKTLEEEFIKKDESKHPKMLVMCEDTSVSPFIVDFLRQEGLEEKDILQIDSNKKGEVSQEDWDKIKQKLFNIDKMSSPKVIVSVLMLREGFDVNNICVIVPLRSAQSSVLLEQTVGRGLRLMWREPVYFDIHQENLEKLKRHEMPDNRLDVLSIIEHPAFMQFYKELEDGLVVEERGAPKRENILGDIITVGLKNDYKKYDLFFPQIIKEQDEVLKSEELNVQKLRPFNGYSIEQLKQFVANRTEEQFYTQDLVTETRFGKYKVSVDLFSASGYNDFLIKIIGCITQNVVGRTKYPVMSINRVSLLRMLDNYIRHTLFNTEFNPTEGNNWRILMLVEKGIIQHIMIQISQIIYDMQNNVLQEEAVVIKNWFSDVSSIKMRDNFSLGIQKSIYIKTQYPSNKGDFEKNFMQFADRDSDVKKLIKIDPNYHLFCALRYVSADGLLRSYFPDFIVQIGKEIFLVETKAQKDIDNVNVQQKEKSALSWCKQVNSLKSEDRMDCIWNYVILDEKSFYQDKLKGNLFQILTSKKLTRKKVENSLF
ncbi:MAG: DEAD/DEAH box helicase family protein [Elusimicrobiaceae bacterium]|nr:DEAD/DEAH box helicase family protein [Elusimicrobiaceae bacterium]